MPDISPTFSDLTPTQATVPNIGSWFQTNIAGAPDTLSPYLAALGYEPTEYQRYYVDGEFAGWLIEMRRTKLQNAAVVQDLMNSMTQAYNEGRAANDTRYEDLLRNLTDLLSKAQTHMDSAKVTLDERIVLYLGDLDDLEAAYDDFFEEVRSDLSALSLTLDADRTRVNNQFDGQIATSQQGLVDRGLYSSALFVSIEAGIEEKRAEALTDISEKEQRLFADVVLRKNEIYINVLRMRTGLIEAKLGLTNRQQQFLEYQLDTQSKLALAMFGFVERREDSYPGMGDIAGVAASLGESGATAS
jgi:hypothetical protein